jgi:predicted metal-dependent peptidase
MNVKLTKARTKLLLDNVFFSTLALKLRPVETKDISTMCTDGLTLTYNPEFVDSLPLNQLMGVICHEVLHCAFLHHTRRGERDPKKWNIAADYAVNYLLLRDFGMVLPDDALFSDEYRGMSVEAIYNNLPDQPEMPECEWGTVEDGSDDDAAGTLAEQENEWTVAVKAAAESAKASGSIPASLQDMLNKAQARVNWREQLSRLLSGSAKTDYNWYPPDVQYIHRHLHVPTLNDPSLGTLAFAIDTSGSVSNEELSQFLGELQSILDQLHFEKITIVHCDTAIHKIEEFEPGEELTAKVYGRGGTSFKPVFEWCEENPVDGLIYFTDMEPYSWPDEPDYPIYWGRTKEKDAPYGNHIDVFRG